MEINKEMENDIKFLLDAVEEFQNKYNRMYITLGHTLGETNLVASATISDDGLGFYNMNKWSNGGYTIQK